MNRRLRLVLAVLIVASSMVTVSSPVQAQAAAEMTMSLTGPSTVLAGDAVRYQVSAVNAGSDPAYNLSIRQVLPVGVSYVPGSTAPSGAGEPRVARDPVTGTTTLAWSNLADAQPGGRFAMSFSVRPDAGAHPVGSSISAQAQVFGSRDPRTVPRFTSAGEPVPVSYDVTATSATRRTDFTSIEIVKSEPSPEGELLRGVHRNWTVYSLDVRTTDRGPHDDVVVVDLLPAALEFLACGGVDHSTGGEEHPGSGPLGAFTVPGSDCLAPASVETVLDPPPTGGVGLPPGVYTRVIWELGSLPAGAERTITYAAAIPLRANALFVTPPAPASLGQAANLDNNTGPSTRELEDEASVRNVAVVTGRYLGEVPGGEAAPRSVVASDTMNRSVEDVRMRKSARDGEFVVGGAETFDVVIETSEYAGATGIVVTDLVPNGMCPLGGPALEGCPAADGRVPSVPFSAVTANDDGSYSLVFEPIGSISAGGSATLTYHAGMRSSYAGGPPGVLPVASGDAFENRVDLRATTTPVDGTGEAGPQEVGDDSSARLGTSDVGIAKTMLPRAAGSVPCPTADLARYVDPEDGDPAFAFRKGDVACFRLTASFAPTSYTRNPVITDFLPVGTEYVPGSAVATEANTVPFETGGPVVPTFVIGDLRGGHRFVDLGGVFDVVLAGRVTGVPDGDLPDVRGNLMKMRVENTAGEARSLRDEVPFPVAPSPQVSLAKGVFQVDGVPSTPNGPGVDGATVRQGSAVTYRIDVTNGGDPARGTDIAVHGLDVWDVLPPGIRCDLVGGITDFLDGDPMEPVHGRCLDPGAAGHPLPEGSSASVIRWTFPTSGDDASRHAIGWEAPANSRTLTYTVTMPTPLSAGLSAALQAPNHAGVRAFAAPTNDGDVATYVPADNIDPTAAPDTWDAPAADDTSWVVTPVVVVDKLSATGITELGNNAASQAVIGEEVRHTLRVDVPAQTSVFHGVLRDQLPANLVVQAVPPPATRFFADAAGTESGPLPAGFAFDPTTGTLTFPPVHTNATAVAQRFEVELTTRVVPGTLNQTQEVTRTNTARFTAAATPDAAGPRVADRTDQTSVLIRQPVPTLTARNSAPGGVAPGGTTVTVTLTAGNLATKPPLHDAFVVDCVPAPLRVDGFAAGTPGPTFGPAPGDGMNGCPVGTTYVAFGLGSLAGGSTTQRSYEVFVPDTVVGRDTFTSQATIRGGSLHDGQPTPQAPLNPIERAYVATASSTFQVQAAGLTKTVQPSRATIGEDVTSTVRLTVPADQTFYDLAVVDRVPAGLTDVVLVGSSCTRDAAAGGGTCDLAPGGLLGPVDDAGGSGRIAFFVGDAEPVPHARHIEITYRATVADDPVALRGRVLVNSAVARWNSVDHDGPITDPNHGWSRSGDPGTAPVTVLEPQVSVAKSVDDPNPEPGDTFTYRVVAGNGAGPLSSDAHDVVVTDTVPVGVVVDEGSIADAGVYDPAARTITWRLAQLAPGASTTLEYLATLAPSATLDRTSLTNTAIVRSYRSWPDGGRTYAGGSATATVTPQFPALMVAKAVLGGPPVHIGDEVTWRVVTTNLGGGRARDLAVTDTLPAHWAYVPGSSRLDGTPLADPQVSGVGDRHLAWAFDPAVELAPGGAATVEYRAVPTAEVVESPGVGSDVAHRNAASSTADDASGAPGNAAGPYRASGTASSRIDAVDLLLTKTGPADVVAGRNVEWSIRVSNPTTPDTTTPTDVATGPFTVVDDLPAGVAHVSSVGPGWSCSYRSAEHRVVCTRTNPADTLAADTAFPAIVVTAAVDPDVAAGTTYTNAAAVEGRTFERDPADNAAAHMATVVTEADLAVTKTRTGGAPAVAGDPLTYAVDVVNGGSSTARAPLTVVDQLDPAVGFVAAGGEGWVCTYDADAHAVTCGRDHDLAAGTAAPSIAVAVEVAASATGRLGNTATVASPTRDPVPADNTSTDSTTIQTRADLRLSKDVIGPPLVAGQTGTFLFRVDNDGPSDAAAAVTVADALPEGFTYAGSSTSVVGGWACRAVAPGVACTLDGALPAGEHATVEVAVRAATDLVGAYTNTATVASPTPDPVPVNNTDAASSEVTGQADLRIAKTGPATVEAGTRLTYQVTVSNAGPSDSVGPLTLTDTLPDGVAFVGATGPGWSCALDGSSPGDVVRCTRRASLAAGSPSDPNAAPPVSVVVDVDPSAGPATLVNRASVTGTTTDPDPANDAASRSVEVVDRAELAVAKTTTVAGPVEAGDTAEFRIVVTNAGPSTADEVTVTDVLPAGLVATGAGGDGWACGPTPATTVACSLAELRPGGSPPLTVTAAVASGVSDRAALTNRAVVASATQDDDPDDDVAEATLDVVARADLAVAKSHPAGAVVAGDDVVFTVDVSNHGPSDAAGPVTVVDTLPGGFRYAAHEGPWTCEPGAGTPDGQQVVCELSTPELLVAGSSAPALRLHATVSPDAEPSATPDSYVNEVDVSSATSDPNPGNDGDDDPVEVETAADLSVEKAVGGPARVGDDLVFTIDVRNAGPSVAQGVRVTDVLPAALSFVSVDAESWTCDHLDGTLTCNLDEPLGAGSDAAPIAVTTTVTPDAHPVVENTAEVRSSTRELADGDNRATTRVPVPPLVDLAVDKVADGELVVGQDVTFTVTVTNHGPTPTAGPVTITDDLPAGLIPAGVPADGCVAQGSTIRCELTEPLAVGEQRSLVIAASVGAEAVPSVANTVTVSTTDEETTVDNNHHTEVVPVTPTAALAVVKELEDVSGDEATWVITVTNQGPNATTMPITMTDPLPEGLVLRSTSGEGWECGALGPEAACSFAGELDVGSSASVQVTTGVEAAPGTTVTNTATVAGGSTHQSPVTASDDLVLPAPADPPAPDDRPPPPAGRGGAGPGLPTTGAGVGRLLALATSLILVGGALVASRRLRRPGAR